MTRAPAMHNVLRTAATAALAIALSGCAAYGAHDPNSPGWFKSRVKETEKEPFPQLAAVPEATPATKSPNEWDAIEADAKAAGTKLQETPASQAAAASTPSDPDAFEAQARADAEQKKR